MSRFWTFSWRTVKPYKIKTFGIESFRATTFLQLRINETTSPFSQSVNSRINVPLLNDRKYWLPSLFVKKTFVGNIKSSTLSSCRRSGRTSVSSSTKRALDPRTDEAKRGLPPTIQTTMGSHQSTGEPEGRTYTGVSSSLNLSDI